jgi:hypothetical protein
MKRVGRDVLAWTWLPVALAMAIGAPVVGAQTEPQGGWVVIPSLGFGVVRDGDWGSAGMEVALEGGYERAGWRWSGYGSLRGLGVGCSHACFDGGPAIAVGVSRSFGALWIGGGAGVMKQLAEWHTLPYGRISLDAAPVRFEARIELPSNVGGGVYVPVLIGIPLSP